MLLLASVLIGLWLAKPAIATSPTIEDQTINPLYGPKQSEPPKMDVGKSEARLSQKTSQIQSYNGRYYSKEEVIQLIKDYSARYGISPDLPLAIARCESGFNQMAKNKSSSASGVYQYLNSTWVGTDEGKAGLSVFDADANVRAAIKYIASRAHARPWEASKHCWNV